ncbi:hypothetical protein CHGG_06951 [Chaetomium globosum CBS 148.51]|uniref:WKF domain-containing protein n=1 Tax=Chaetomium globosum (strain ATCC 6205 / CBS 148.51 / DSM 1962 / NBRC 6347 / NRRL 1970) TaxID=306901 RepID=Q2GYK3_CHAGB|nr:uncharacterized protein CHGG_06951 [Chaetomium globosum CBS 148.51]EAQ85698.1 hypothetical protein CHGG_06951 [Chaetomium globosum CBS 148.51]
MSAHVPAWKRLGLKLKGSSSGEAIPSSVGPNSRAKPSAQTPNSHQTRINGSPASALKRKQPSSASTPSAVTAQTPNKKPRREDQSAADQGTPSSLRKSVSFANDTKNNTKEKAKPKKAKSKKAKKPSSTAKFDFSLEPSLAYIRQWHTARDSWKFNKNHQTLLIKYLFDGDKVPSTDIPIFYEYIRDLKGFVRTRLRETAAEIKKKDMEAGAGAFPAALKDKETKQKEYEETISRFLQDLQRHQQRRQSNSNSSSKNANGKRSLDEVEYVLRVATPEIKQRLLKRIRAELVVDELSDGEEESSTSAASEGAATTTATETSSSSASSSARDPTTTTTAAAAAGTGTATGRSDGSQQPAKRRRLRNVRTAIDDDDDSSSSSESESGESGSEESSSDSDDSDSDDEMDLAPDGTAAAESSSSSSSSSASEGESEADSDSEGGSEAGTSGSDED